MLLIRHGRSADVVPGSPESADPPLHEQGVNRPSASPPASAERPSTPSTARSWRVPGRPLLRSPPPAASPWWSTPIWRRCDWATGATASSVVGPTSDDPEWVAWSRTGRWDGIPGGEGDDAFRARVAGVIDQLAARHQGQHHRRRRPRRLHQRVRRRTCWASTGRCCSRSRTPASPPCASSPDGPTLVTVNDCHHLYDPVLGND